MVASNKTEQPLILLNPKIYATEGSTVESKCFTTEYFTGCVESLLKSDEMPSYRKMIEYLAK
ncbi:hypothetical protein HUJ05_007162 [Dendroctonus ponderosae]|nr:hypothetical protein HUJ05_007162 [Dendroctonus ponderosae]